MSKPAQKQVAEKCVQDKPIKFYGIAEVKEELAQKAIVRSISEYKKRQSVETPPSPPPVNFLDITLEKESSISKRISSPKVLIIDDDNIVSGFLEHLFTKNGFEPIIARNGREALKFLETTLPPDLVIMDIMLPFADGYQLLRAIRANQEWGEVPVMMLTSKGREQDVVRAFDGGANDYLIKPFQSEELMARASRFVR